MRSSGRRQGVLSRGNGKGTQARRTSGGRNGRGGGNACQRSRSRCWDGCRCRYRYRARTRRGALQWHIGGRRGGDRDLGGNSSRSRCRSRRQRHRSRSSRGRSRRIDGSCSRWHTHGCGCYRSAGGCGRQGGIRAQQTRSHSGDAGGRGDGGAWSRSSKRLSRHGRRRCRGRGRGVNRGRRDRGIGGCSGDRAHGSRCGCSGRRGGGRHRCRGGGSACRHGCRCRGRRERSAYWCRRGCSDRSRRHRGGSCWCRSIRIRGRSSSRCRSGRWRYRSAGRCVGNGSGGSGRRSRVGGCRSWSRSSRSRGSVRGGGRCDIRGSCAHLRNDGRRNGCRSNRCRCGCRSRHGSCRNLNRYWCRSRGVYWSRGCRKGGARHLRCRYRYKCRCDGSAGNGCCGRRCGGERHTHGGRGRDVHRRDHRCIERCDDGCRRHAQWTLRHVSGRRGAARCCYRPRYRRGAGFSAAALARAPHALGHEAETREEGLQLQVTLRLVLLPHLNGLLLCEHLFKPARGGHAGFVLQQAHQHRLGEFNGLKELIHHQLRVERGAGGEEDHSHGSGHLALSRCLVFLGRELGMRKRTGMSALQPVLFLEHGGPRPHLVGVIGRIAQVDVTLGLHRSIGVGSTKGEIF
jgi:hypothetical protein